MNDRQAFALAHPLDSASPDVADIARFRTATRLTRHEVLISILAVDR